MKQVELQSLAGKSVEILFHYKKDAENFANFINNMQDDEQFLTIDKTVKEGIYRENEEIIEKLLKLYKSIQFVDVNNELMAFNAIQETIKYIKRLESFFYNIIRLDDEDKN